MRHAPFFTPRPAGEKEEKVRMTYRNPWREACENAKQLLRLGLTPEEVVERTRLPKSTIDRIAPPILRENAQRKAVEEAERAVEREHRKVLKEKYPCPMCGKGYGVAEGGAMTAFLNGAVQPRGLHRHSRIIPVFPPILGALLQQALHRPAHVPPRFEGGRIGRLRIGRVGAATPVPQLGGRDGVDVVTGRIAQRSHPLVG